MEFLAVVSTPGIEHSSIIMEGIALLSSKMYLLHAYARHWSGHSTKVWLNAILFTG
jgi:hypothetical protein